MSQKKFARVGEILPTVLKTVGLDQKLKERDVLASWAEVVGKDIAARTRAIKLDKKVLYVSVDHSAWMQELHFMEKEILKRLREKNPDVEIQRIRFGTGR